MIENRACGAAVYGRPLLAHATNLGAAEADDLRQLLAAEAWCGENCFVTEPGPSLSAGRLQAILKAEGYPSSAYGIGRRGQYMDQAFVIDKWSSRWVVYYTERGSKTDIRKHATEHAACRDLLARIRGGSADLRAGPRSS